MPGKNRERDLLWPQSQKRALREGPFKPQKQWSERRERQYRRIKDSERKQGKSEGHAKEIEACTVNKVRAQGESVSGAMSKRAARKSLAARS